MIVYEVNVDVRDRRLRRLSRMARRPHVEEMLALPGFVSAEILERRDPPPSAGMRALTVHYRLTDDAALQRYLAEYAPRMREDGVRRFGDAFTATRRVLWNRLSASSEQALLDRSPLTRRHRNAATVLRLRVGCSLSNCSRNARRSLRRQRVETTERLAHALFFVRRQLLERAVALRAAARCSGVIAANRARRWLAISCCSGARSASARPCAAAAAAASAAAVCHCRAPARADRCSSRRQRRPRQRATARRRCRLRRVGRRPAPPNAARARRSRSATHNAHARDANERAHRRCAATAPLSHWIRPAALPATHRNRGSRRDRACRRRSVSTSMSPAWSGAAGVASAGASTRSMQADRRCASIAAAAPASPRAERPRPPGPLPLRERRLARAVEARQRRRIEIRRADSSSSAFARSIQASSSCGVFIGVPPARGADSPARAKDAS